MQELTSLIAHYGLAFVFLNVFLVQSGVPLPAVPTLMVAGALAAGGVFSAPLLVVLAVVAALLGDLIWYYAGWHYGSRVLKLLCRVSLSPDSCVRQTENILERWGVGSLIVAKFVPGFSTVAPPLAGAMRLGLAPFLFYSAVGAALWALAAVGAGMIFSAQVDWLIERLAAMGATALPVVALLIGLFAAGKWWERYRLLKSLRMARLSVEDLYAMIERGEGPVLLDARAPTARRLDPRRISGAREFDESAAERSLAGIDPQREIIVYCT